MILSTPFLIFSAERETLSPKENLQRTTEAVDTLAEADINYLTVRGRYGGVEETSFLVHASHEKTVAGLCAEFDQDCFLAVDSLGHGYLVYADRPDEPIGKLEKQTTKPAGDHSEVNGVFFKFRGYE